MLEPDSRLRVARGFGENEKEASAEAFQQLKARGQDEPPALLSDGYGAINEALIEVYGTIPPYAGRGRRPTVKQPGRTWKYRQMVKVRNGRGRVIWVRHRTVHGSAADTAAVVGDSTAYVERTHLTTRIFNARYVRRGLAFSKKRVMHRAASRWEDAVYNFVRPVKTLRVPDPEGDPHTPQRFQRRWRPRTPAMAAGITHRLWSLRQLLRTIPIPIHH